MDTESKLERWSEALVSAAVFGDSAAVERFGITDRTLRNYRRAMAADPDLRQRYQQKLARGDAARAGELLDAAAAEIVAVAALAGWPEVRRLERGRTLPGGRRVGLRIQLKDGSVMLCEALTASAPDPAPVLGALLFAYESLRAGSRIPVRLCVLAECDAPPLWSRVVAHLDVEVIFCNIAEVMRRYNRR